MKSSKKNNNGYTLIELLISISIIVALSTVVFVNYHKMEKNYALKRSTYQLATEFRQVEKMILGANEFEGKFPEGGYGIYIAPTTNTIVFADIKQGSNAPNKRYDPNPNNEKVNEIVLEPNVKISAISPNNVAHIIFLAPIPKIIFTDKNGNKIADTIDEINIELELSQSNSIKTQTIKINKVGKIEIK